jgi:hypothetical protein
MAPLRSDAAAQRQAKLKDIEAQVKRGSLTIRTMTAAERKLNPPRPRHPHVGKGAR